MIRMCFLYLLIGMVSTGLGRSRDFKSIPTEPTVGDRMLESYFEKQTERLEIMTMDRLTRDGDWAEKRSNLHRELQEMLGLMPWPERTDLEPVIRGSFVHEGVIIEKLQFQSRPGLYVTANFYHPENQEGPLPTILYVCGHGRVMDGKVSLGNKAHYHHHPLWFAKNGYTCLIIDTLQLGEIEGIHHGTYRHDRWWWNSRGYTPAGVEAWNGMRAIDYLETRPEVDKEKIGITGRSGGGAYTFWTAAMDERIKVAVPVAGITSMRNHIVGGCIEGHCDCMFMVNTYQWDFPLLAAAIAPRPQLIVNTDNDRIFPTDGVVDVFLRTRKAYERAGARDNLGLSFYQGPHKDTQPIRVAAFHWFERHLKGKKLEHEMEQTAAPKTIEPKSLRVFDGLPEDEINTKIDESFVATASREALPEAEDEWLKDRSEILAQLRKKSFRAWPDAAHIPISLRADSVTDRDGMVFKKYRFISQEAIGLPLYFVHRAGLEPKDLDLIVLNVLNEKNWNEFLENIGAAFPEAFDGIELPELVEKNYQAEAKMHANMKWGMAYLPPRGIGPTAWTTDPRERVQIRRRFALLGQTIDSMRVWDIRRGIQALRSIDGGDKPSLWIQSSDVMAGNALYASLFESGVHRLDLHSLPLSHRVGPEFLNVLRYLDIPQAVAFAAKNSQIRIYTNEKEKWAFPEEVAKRYEWEGKPIGLRDPVVD